MSTRIATAERWRRLLRVQRGSGLSIAAFCRREGVSQPSFYGWRRKLQMDVSFAEVKLLAGPKVQARGVELRLPGRLRIVVRPGFDRHMLLELLHTLEDHSSARSAREAGA